MHRRILLIFSLFSTLSYGQIVVDAGNDTTICAGESVRLGGNPTVAGGLAPYTYTWTPNTAISNPSLANPTASPTVTTEYKVSITDANGRSAKDSLVITVLLADEVTLNDTSVCDNDGTFMLAHGFPTGGKYSGTGIPDSLNFDVSASGLGTFQIIYHYTDTNCGAKIKDTASITVNPAPQISIHSLTDTICKGDTATLSVAQLDTVSTQYLWGPGPFVGSDTASMVQSVPDTTTNYTLLATNHHGCTEQTSRSISVQECVGINELENVKDIELFPNPTHEEINIHWQLSEPAYLQLLNAQGQVVITKKIISGNNIIQINNQSPGLYVVRIPVGRVLYIGQVVIK